tara:strand:+ start:1085 stop:2167 length:1083 start_codon:yes stop_codon:yes gene_type:complete
MKKYCLHFEENKRTNGQRFFKTLYSKLHSENLDKSHVILFNISANIWDIIKNKILGKKIVLRVAALYFDEFDDQSIRKKSILLKSICYFLRYLGFSNNLISDIFNFFDRNYGVFIRVIFADFLIHQSNFSKRVMDRYFKNKPSTIIPNGSINRFSMFKLKNKKNKTFKLLTVYDSNRLSKRIYDLLKFIEFANSKSFKCSLTVLGFDDKICPGYPSEISKLLRSKNIILVPRFNKFNSRIINFYNDSDAFISFTYRDACPNIIIEAMSFKLPIIAFNSGGISDLISDSNFLLKLEDKLNYHVPHRYNHKFPKIYYEEVLNFISTIKDNPIYHIKRIEEDFLENLEINRVADKYDSFLKSL